MTMEAAREAMVITFVHWGVHAWAIYGIVGLSLAYFSFRYNLPLTIRSGLYPLFKNRINGPIGDAVDIFAICGTLFGIATSLGFGVLQINSGLHYLFGLPNELWVQIPLIVVITLLAMASVLSGLDVGIRRLSELNLLCAILLLLFVLAVGPTTFLLKAFVQNVGTYLDHFFIRTFNLYAYEPRTWLSSWTLFYWAWWIAWSPFVGMFIARISRGRTVRQFIGGVLFIPSGFSFLWMTVFGNTAIWLDMNEASGAIAAAVSADVSVALFQFFTYLPFSAVASGLAVLLVAIFFVTSADFGFPGDRHDRRRRCGNDSGLAAGLLVQPGRAGGRPAADGGRADRASDGDADLGPALHLHHDPAGRRPDPGHAGRCRQQPGGDQHGSPLDRNLMDAAARIDPAHASPEGRRSASSTIPSSRRWRRWRRRCADAA